MKILIEIGFQMLLDILSAGKWVCSDDFIHEMGTLRKKDVRENSPLVAKCLIVFFFLQLCFKSIWPMIRLLLRA